jgi:hypothetical protein
MIPQRPSTLIGYHFMPVTTLSAWYKRLKGSIIARRGISTWKVKAERSGIKATFGYIGRLKPA